ncbi:MAG: hypothetical protein WD766_02255 [Gemmatimonadota bacterium]
MLRRNYCSRCAKRLPASAERCVACGGAPRIDEKEGQVRTAVLVFALAITIVIAVGFSDRYVPAVADWYTRVVIQYLPEPAHRFTPGPDDRRAFYVCARSVVRAIENDLSVATFAAEDEMAVPLGNDRYRVASYVDEALLDGRTQRREFTCTVRLEDGDWRLEAVELEPAPPLMPIAAR